MWLQWGRLAAFLGEFRHSRAAFGKRPACVDGSDAYRYDLRYPLGWPQIGQPSSSDQWSGGFSEEIPLLGRWEGRGTTPALRGAEFESYPPSQRKWRGTTYQSNPACA